MCLRPLFFLVAAVSLNACVPADSGDLDSADLYAEFSVTSNGGTSEVVARLRVGSGGNTAVNLTDGDELVVDNGLFAHVMSKRSNGLNDIEYVWEYLGDPGLTAYTITFNRPTRGESIASSATLPTDFVISSPDYGASYTAADTLPVQWSVASGEDMNIQLAGSCGVMNATAAANKTSADLVLTGVAPLATSTGTGCSLSVVLVRDGSVAVNAAFGAGGEFRTAQKRGTAIDFSY